MTTDEIGLSGTTIRFAHPTAGADLLYEGVGDEKFPPYWAELWPSGVELAYEVSTYELGGLSVLELGCGVGLPSIAAALSGGRVLATDRSRDAAELAGDNARRNGVTVETAECSWEQPDSLLEGAPWDLVLAADVLYEQRNVSWLLSLLPRLVDRAGEVWITDPRRTRADDFLTGVVEDWRLSTSATRIPAVDLHRLRLRK
ncbi:putative nicotinamide N-methyase [Saccharopolyspora lacisalsi]|uniref:Putative nicotinamide N-methyase n=1 Tax=Halosaccharopolyspora lacisalsi TaxID=1000566 RepID=A0A839E0N8_9PSEU|nr:methyltransferase domain-containing protein [Halosaccharopolyspora lacisalsi]MBA8826479.1 putative nicotinamide N-methyase [Halosaccharopolyspora lacisalsi]